VDEASFRSTQASLSAALKYNILDKFGVDWTQTQYEDLSKPLHSGIAAMLKIAKHYGSTDIPQSVASQASYWASSYTINTWTDAIYVYTKPVTLLPIVSTLRLLSLTSHNLRFIFTVFELFDVE